MPLAFLKMNGAGNDFIIFDARKTAVCFTAEQVRRIAARANAATKGCDQVIVLEPPPSADADIFMRIYNADGGEVEACGNATRCAGWLMMREKAAPEAVVQTRAGSLKCKAAEPDAALWPRASGVVAADMGEPRFAWEEIPLSRPCADTLRLEIGAEGLADAAAVGMGNPHVVFFTENPAKLDAIGALGPRMQHHPLFAAHGVNVTIARALPEKITARVWERGAGITAACGTAACATAVAAVKRGLAARNQDILVEQHTPSGGNALLVRWIGARFGDTQNGHVFLTGPVEEEFRGEMAL